jgi:hypothetical protein
MTDDQRFILQWEIKPLPIPAFLRGYTGELVLRAPDLSAAMAAAKRRLSDEYRVKPERIEITSASFRSRAEASHGIY